MQCVLREKLSKQTQLLMKISNIYQSEGHRFVAAYFDWLNEAEKDLSGLRSPISGLLQAEKSSLISILDGYIPDHIQPTKSLRKIQKAATAQSLEKISKEFFSKIRDIDANFEQLNEKMCHAIAIIASKYSDTYEKLQLNQQGVDMIWALLANTPETLPMYNYFCAKLTSVDINYLLMDIIQKIISNRSTSD